MNTRTVILAVEDALSKAVAGRILAAYGVGITVTIGMEGSGYLKTKARDLNRSARKGPCVFMLTDMDKMPCPTELIRSWAVGPQHANFLLRVAVVEVESWVMADHAAFGHFAKIQPARIPVRPDELGDPKRTLVNLVRKSSSSLIRSELVPVDGSTAAVGPAYNPALTSFVMEKWSPHKAAVHSPSLHRTLNRIKEFAAR